MKKLISMAVTLSMLLGICSANVANAAVSPARFSAVQGDNVTVDLHSSLYGMIYMDEASKTAAYQGNDFLFNGALNPAIVAIAWPPALRERTVGADAFPEQQATIDNSNNTLTSKRSGVTYKLPTRNAPSATESADGTYHFSKEGLILDYKAKNSASFKGVAQARELTVNKKVDRIHLLLGSAQTSGDKNFVQAYVTYTDGTTSLPTATVSNSGAWNVSVKFPSDVVVNSEAADGRNGYLYAHMQTAKKADQSANNNFVADFETYVYNHPSTITDEYTNGNYTDFASDAKHVMAFEKNTTADSSKTIAAYEYALNVDESKTVDKLIISGANSGPGRAGFVVLGVATKKTATTPAYDDLADEKNANLFVKAETGGYDSYKGEWNMKNFLGAGMSNKDCFVSIQWPLQALGNPATKGTLTNVSGTTATIKSNYTGNTYTITNSTGEDAKDAIILDGVRNVSANANALGFTLPASAEVDLDDAACSQVSFLTAHASYASRDIFKAYVKYTDGTTSLPAGELVEGSDNTAKEAQLSGNDGYVYGKLPYYQGGLSEQRAKKFVMRLKSFAYDYDAGIESATSPTRTFSSISVVGDDAQSRQAMVYEHVLKVNPNKIVDKIVFENIASGNYIEGIAVLGVATNPVFVANPIEVTDGAFEVDAYSEVEGEVYAAVYVRATKKLVAAKKIDLPAYAPQTITIETNNIHTAGNYDIKLFIWATDGTFKPLSAPLTDQYRAPAAE